jgi:hypothetical protein
LLALSNPSNAESLFVAHPVAFAIVEQLTAVIQDTFTESAVDVVGFVVVGKVYSRLARGAGYGSELMAFAMLLKLLLVEFGEAGRTGPVDCLFQLPGFSAVYLNGEGSALVWL